MQAHIKIEFEHIQGKTIHKDEISVQLKAHTIIDALQRLLEMFNSGEMNLRMDERVVACSTPTHKMDGYYDTEEGA